MKPITVKFILDATGGVLLGGKAQGRVTSVAIDSRKVEQEGIFVAIPGERVDGHQFIPQAAKAGCTAALVSKAGRLDKASADELGFALIGCENTVTALQELAKAYMELRPLKKVGVTGSTGKTTTKEMTWRVLSEKYKTVRNRLNLNNDIGLPLSAFNIEEDTEAVVFEMGMDHLGEIHRLVEIVRPQVGIITNVSITHIETLGSRENIFKAKMEITDFFGSENTLIINCDSEPLKREFCSGPWKTVAIGENRQEGEPFIEISDLKNLGEEGISFILSCQGESLSFHLPVPGVHNAHNAACAVAAGLALGVSMEEASMGLAKLESTDKRLNITQVKGMKIIDDTYNANPDSMRAGLDTLAEMEGKRHIAMLSDMLGLGEHAVENHFSLGQYAAGKDLDLVITVGELSAHTARGVQDASTRTKVIHFEKQADLEGELSELFADGDVVLVKGSRATAMDNIVRKMEQL